MSIVLIIILISFYTIDFLNIFIYFVLIFIIPLSISMIFEGISKNFQEYVKLGFNNKFYEIPVLEKKISYNTILSFLIGIIFYFLWILTKNWFICDLIAIGISLVSTFPSSPVFYTFKVGVVSEVLVAFALVLVIPALFNIELEVSIPLAFIALLSTLLPLFN
jgi:hypothetical protein